MSHSIALVNITDGSVQGHAANCADLKRGALRKHADEVWTLEVDTKVEAWEAYNGDFIAECYDHDTCDEAKGECRNAYEIDWKPCANHVPDFAEAPVEEAPVERSQDVVVKRGRIWTYIYQGETLLAEVRTDAADAVIAALQS